jgi:hypothetical protein
VRLYATTCLPSCLKTKLQIVRLLWGPQTSFSICKMSNLPSTRNVLSNPSGMIMQDWRQNVTCGPAFTLQRPDRFWGLPSLLSSGHRLVKLTIHLHLVLRSRIVELYLHSPIHIHGVVLNYLIKDRVSFTFLPFMLLVWLINVPFLEIGDRTVVTWYRHLSCIH